MGADDRSIRVVRRPRPADDRPAAPLRRSRGRRAGRPVRRRAPRLQPARSAASWPTASTSRRPAPATTSGAATRPCARHCRADDLRADLPRVMDDVVRRIAFGVGRASAVARRPRRPRRDPDDRLRPQRALYETAAAQLGTVGSGNHFVDVMEDEEGFVWVGVHFGSRGFGHKTATYFLDARRRRQGDGGAAAPPPRRERRGRRRTWRRWSSRAATRSPAATWWSTRCWTSSGRTPSTRSTTTTTSIWRETHGGEDCWVVRKGATPAFPGQRGFVGASMGEPAVILRAPSRREARAVLDGPRRRSGDVADAGRREAP